eukprot:1156219-Pelagomonas_calceolata.AAC.1
MSGGWGKREMGSGTFVLLVVPICCFQLHLTNHSMPTNPTQIFRCAADFADEHWLGMADGRASISSLHPQHPGPRTSRWQWGTAHHRWPSEQGVAKNLSRCQSCSQCLRCSSAGSNPGWPLSILGMLCTKL